MKANQEKQAHAIQRFRRHLEDLCSRSEKFPMAITEWNTKTTDYGTLWITAQLEHTTLSENSVLRFLDHQYWLVRVGPLGRLTVKMAPKSYEQFNNDRAFGMKFKLGNIRQARRAAAKEVA